MENPWTEYFTEHETPYKGYVSTMEQFDDLFRSFSETTNAKFVKSGGKVIDFTATLAMPCRILWENEAVTYTGFPFVNTGWYSFDCHLGIDRNKPVQEHVGEKRKRTKKIGCPARIVVRKNLIIQDEAYHVKIKSRGRLIQAAQKLRALIKTGEGFSAEVRLYLKLPEFHVHKIVQPVRHISAVSQVMADEEAHLNDHPEDITQMDDSTSDSDIDFQEESSEEEFEPHAVMVTEESEEESAESEGMGEAEGMEELDEQNSEELDEGGDESGRITVTSTESPSVSLIDTSATPWVNHFTDYDSPYTGYVTSMEQLEDLLSAFYLGTYSQFSKSGGKAIDFNGSFSSTAKITWQNDLVPFTGYPFINLAWNTYSCHLGNSRLQRTAQPIESLMQNAEGQKQRRYKRRSLKTGCPAKIMLRKVLIILEKEFKLRTKSKGKQGYLARKLHSVISNKMEFVGEVRMYLKLPQSHNHPTDSDVRFKIDKSIEAKVEELVRDGFTNAKQVRPIILLHISDLFQGQEIPSDRRFNPTQKDIYNMIYKYTKRMKSAKRVKKVESEVATEALCEMQEEDELPAVYLEIGGQPEGVVISQTMEIRASLTDFDKFVSQAKILSNSDGKCMTHEDTYFNVPEGRLKLRVSKDSSGSSAALIFYARSDENELSTSPDYNSNEVSHPEGLRETLRLAYGVLGTITKKRWTFIIDRVKLHADLIHGLGSFIKLEVGLTAQEGIDDGNQIVTDLVQRLGVQNMKILSGDYLELLSKKTKNVAVW